MERSKEELMYSYAAGAIDGDGAIYLVKEIRLYIPFVQLAKKFGILISSFKNDFGVAENTPIEECKQIALGRFIEICNTYGKNANLGVSIGFSDDDKKNVESIKKYFEEKSNTHINLRFSVFDTSTKDVNRTKFIKGIKEDMGSDLGNRQANLLRFDSFNSQANTLTNSTNDFTGFNNAQKVKIASKLYKNILLKKSRKAKNKVKKKRDE